LNKSDPLGRAVLHTVQPTRWRVQGVCDQAFIPHVKDRVVLIRWGAPLGLKPSRCFVGAMNLPAPRRVTYGTANTLARAGCL